MLIRPLVPGRSGVEVVLSVWKQRRVCLIRSGSIGAGMAPLGCNNYLTFNWPSRFLGHFQWAGPGLLLPGCLPIPISLPFREPLIELFWISDWICDIFRIVEHRRGFPDCRGLVDTRHES
tara:strand:+ start:1134 stop:1493 length:360 start_codon:yes stop_codon:yes gene_type:complete